MQDDTGRCSHWSGPIQFEAGVPLSQLDPASRGVHGYRCLLAELLGEAPPAAPARAEEALTA